MTDTDFARRRSRFPRAIDATPADGESHADGYGRSFLEAAGHLTDPDAVETTYVAGSSVEYLASTDGATTLAYFELAAADAPPATPARIAAALRRRTRLEYGWFFDPETGAVRVFRTAQPTAAFRYDPTCEAARRERLERARTDIDALFDRSGRLERLAGDLETHQRALARALSADSSRHTERTARLAAQRYVHRLYCWYFLVERGLIGLVDGSGAVVPADPARLFERLVRETDGFAGLLRAVGDRLASDRRDELAVTDSLRLHVPTLAPGLFESSSRPLETAAGTTFGDDDQESVAGDFDWAAVVDDCNAYEWRLEAAGRERSDSPAVDHAATDLPRDLVSTDDADDPATTVTPSVLGDALESVTVAGSIDSGSSLDAFDDHETSVNDDGSSAVGAYYTDEAITGFAVRRALWEALRERLEAGIEDGSAPSALERTDLYRPASERRASIEGAQRDGFDVLFEAHSDDREVLAYVDANVRELTVCDPAAGTGAFVRAVANTLFEWHAMCRPDVDPFALRRDVLDRNVFGVELRERTTAVCKFRLWLWLAGALPFETEPRTWARESSAERPTVPPVPNVDRSVRSGNSLLGAVDLDDLPGIDVDAGANTADSLAERLRSYVEARRAAAASAGSIRSTNVAESSVSTESDAPGSHERPQPTARYESLRTDLNAAYARSTRDPATGDPTRLPDRVSTPDEAARSLAVGASDATALRVETADAIPDALETSLAPLGFTTYTYTARHESPSLECDRERLEELFSLLDTHLGGDDWTVRVDREYAGRDFQATELDACHWPLEFPRVFLEGDGFDVVVSNPPYNADVPPAAEPLLNSTATYECQGASDTCEWFYERALDLATDAGVVAMLVPKSVAFYRSWADIRETLLAETSFVHVLDVGLGFEGVTLETIAMVQTLSDGARSDADTGGEPGDGDRRTPTIHRTRDLRNPSANRPVHLGWTDQRFMRDSETIIFRPITDAEASVLERLLAADRRLGAVASGEPTRQLYVPDREKARLESGSDPYIDAVPWVRPYHLTDVRHVDLSAHRDAVERHAVPRVMLKVMRGSRLRAWLDPRGHLIGTEKLVSVPLGAHTRTEIAFIYAAVNHPLVSYYLQKAIFSETTETARVMDGHYSRSIPIPDPEPAVESAVARLAWALTLACQCAHDTDRAVTGEADALQDALEALVAGCYLNREDVCRPWARSLERDGPSERTIAEVFDAFYADRFATRGAVPAARWNEIEALLEEFVAVTSTWETDRVLDSPAMRAVTDVLE